MKMRIPLPALALAAACLAAQALAQAQASVTLPPELERVLRDYETAWTAGRPAELAQLFTPDGFALPNGQPPRRGVAEIRAGYADGGTLPLALRALDYSISGDLAYVVGAFGPAAGQPDAGKFVLLLKRGADGRWLIAADIDNMNRPPARPPAAPARP